MLKSITAGYGITRRCISVGNKIYKRPSFSRGIERDDDQSSKSSYYDQLGYWDTKFSVSEDESLRHGLLIPKIPVEEIGVDSNKGRRTTNEDRYIVERLSDSHVLIAVFDGHGNSTYVDHCTDKLQWYFRKNINKHKMKTGEALCEAIKDMDKDFTEHARITKDALEEHDDNTEIIHQNHSTTIHQKLSELSQTGSTVTAVVIEDGLFIHWAWVGDSRGIICRNGVGRRLTFDHSLDSSNPFRSSEIERIEASNGAIQEDRGYKRIYCGEKGGSINMTRALGNIARKQYGIISEPSTKSDLPKGDRDYARIRQINHSTDAFIAIITDGISGPMSVKEITSEISRSESAKDGARHLVDRALALGSDDNCTAIVVPLGAWGKYREPSTFIVNRNFMSLGSRGY